MYKLSELDGKNKAALKKMKELAKIVRKMNMKIGEFECKRNKALSDFRAELQCFPDARYVYYHYYAGKS
jgi:hypothetical protein